VMFGVSGPAHPRDGWVDIFVDVTNYFYKDVDKFSFPADPSHPDEPAPQKVDTQRRFGKKARD